MYTQKHWLKNIFHLETLVKSEDIYEIFYKKLNYKLNLDDPKTLNEKIQWIKFNGGLEKKFDEADKYLVRNKLKAKGLTKYLTKIYGVYDTYDAFIASWDSYPEKFVVKPNHWCDVIYFVDKKNTDIKYDYLYFSELTKTIKSTYGQNEHEVQYRDIKPKIIVEEFLGAPLTEYRLFCFNGDAKYIMVDLVKPVKILDQRTFYDLNWNKMNFSYKYNGKFIDNPDFKKPDFLEKMIDISNKLSSQSILLRVDFFEVNNDIIISELVHTPASGFMEFYPKEIDLKLGKLLKLPDAL